MLLSLSIVVSLFGIVNTLVLTVFERTRELGMLRAVGMSRRQVRRMIRHESVITALLGAAFGIPLGVVLAALIGAAINFAAFTVPVGTLIVFVIAAIIAGLIAAIWPARRAGRLNVLAGSAVRVGVSLRSTSVGNPARRPFRSARADAPDCLGIRRDCGVLTHTHREISAITPTRQSSRGGFSRLLNRSLPPHRGPPPVMAEFLACVVRGA